MFASVARRGRVFAPTIAALLATWILAVSATALIGVEGLGLPGLVGFPGPVQWSADYPQQIILATVVRSGGEPAAASSVALIPAGPGSVRPLAEAIARRARGKVPGLKVTCDDDVNDESTTTAMDLATFGTASQGACAFTSDALSSELYRLTGADPSRRFAEPSLTTSRARFVVPGAADGSRFETTAVRLSLGGARRWAIGVDRACARRVAVVPDDGDACGRNGQNGDDGDAYGRNGQNGDDASRGNDPPPSGDEAWRATIFGGGAGRGTGRERYAVYGAGGGGGRPGMNYTVWLELRGGSNGGVGSRACVEAVVARADRDWETETARAVRKAMPGWAQTFAKMHTPLKLAHVVSTSV